MNSISYKIMIFLFFSFFIGGILHGDTVKVGLPLVPDIIYRDDKGEPGGFYLDLIKALSEDEDWTIEWVDGSWQESYEKLLAGTIDMLPVAAVTEERKEDLLFLDTAVITTWSELYIHRENSIKDPLDLNQKRIGLVNGDNNSRNFTTFIQDFGVEYYPVSYESHEEAIQGLFKGEIFVFAGPSRLDKNSSVFFKNAGLHFNPVNSTIAFRKGFSPEIRSKLNKKLISWKNNKDSPYHKLLIYYGMSFESERECPGGC